MAGLRIETRRTGGGRVIYFPFMVISDMHLGAKGLSRPYDVAHMLQHTGCDRLVLAGDILDGKEMMKQDEWRLNQWDREVIAHFLRKASLGTQIDYLFGNHDEALGGERIKGLGFPVKRRQLAGKSMLGINFERTVFHTDPGGKTFLVHHGHKTLKNAFDRSFYGTITGHTHNPGFFHTGGKVNINTGSCAGAGCIQALVHDRDGKWAILAWHREGLFVREKGQEEYFISWDKFGIDSLYEPPLSFKDEHTYNASRLMKLVYRLFPPKSRVAVLAAIRQRNVELPKSENPLADKFALALRRNRISEEIRFITSTPVPGPKEATAGPIWAALKISQ